MGVRFLESFGPKEDSDAPQVPAEVRHQVIEPPFERVLSGVWKLTALFALAFFVHGVVDPGGPDPIAWCLEALALGWLVTLLVAALGDGRIPLA
jgi:hypothetical protein